SARFDVKEISPGNVGAELGGNRHCLIGTVNPEDFGCKLRAAASNGHLLFGAQSLLEQAAVAASRVENQIVRPAHREGGEQSRHVGRRVVLSVAMPFVSGYCHYLTLRYLLRAFNIVWAPRNPGIEVCGVGRIRLFAFSVRRERSPVGV